MHSALVHARYQTQNDIFFGFTCAQEQLFQRRSSGASKDLSVFSIAFSNRSQYEYWPCEWTERLISVTLGLAFTDLLEIFQLRLPSLHRSLEQPCSDHGSKVTLVATIPILAVVWTVAFLFCLRQSR